MTPLEMLVSARDFLKENPDKWGQGKYIDYETDKYCMLGAIYYRQTKGLKKGGKKIDILYSTYCVAYEVLIKHPKLNKGSIIEWNDTPGRTVEDVISVLEDVINDANN